VAGEACRDGVTPTSRRTHGSNELDIDKLHARCVAQIIPVHKG
jgi:hypothetical protein